MLGFVVAENRHANVNTNTAPTTWNGESRRSSARRTMNVLREHLNVLDRCRRQNAMSEIENMPWPAADAFQNAFRLVQHAPRWAEQERRIEIPLNRAVEADVLPCLIDRHAPVHADDIAAGFAQFTEHHRRSGSEMNRRYAARNCVENLLRVR